MATTNASIFDSVDVNGDGKISRQEIIHFIDLVFISTDADGDGHLTVEEFLQWDPGYLAMAEGNDRAADMNDVKRDIYGSRDLNGDGTLEHDEFSVASLYDFYKAEVNHDRTLSQDELLNHYQIIRRVRLAIR
ncbi:CREC-EF hand family protein [Geminicoccus harenae]|uniref:hypothetical protein n=1 Tax=Geminicoccus harenae TaxID=2498453 RepID=UPI00168B846A|nr:hypothetical protein [Geminicoccus harenae]